MGASQFFTNRQLPHTEAYAAQLIAASTTASKPNPSGQFIGFVNALIAGLIGDDNWYILDRLWMFATEQQCHAVIGVINPAGLNKSWSALIVTEKNPANLAWHNAQGYTSDGSTSYIESNYSVFGSNQVTQNSISIGVYSRTPLSAANNTDMGVYVNASTATIGINCSNAAGDLKCPLNDTSPNSEGAITDSKSLITGSRSSSTQTTGYYRGAAIGPAVNNSSASPITNIPLAILAANGFTVVDFSNRQIAMAFVGTGAINQSALYTRIQAFAILVGFNV